MDAHNITASPLAYKGSKYGSASNLVWNPNYGLKSKPVYMLSFIFMRGLFFQKQNEVGRRQTALPPEKSIISLHSP